MSGTRLNYSIFAGGYVLPTTGLMTTGDGAFRENDKIVIDENLNTKEETYLKAVQGDKILLNSSLKYDHDWHSNIENRFQGLSEISDYSDPNATVMNIPRTRRVAFSNVDSSKNCVLVDGNEESNRTLVHQSSNGSADFEEIWLWAYNDSDKALDLTIEFGGMSNSVEVGAPIAFNSKDTLKIKIPSRSGLFQIFTGQILQNSLRVTAFAEESNKITLHGHVNKIKQRNLNNPTGESPILVTDSVIGWGENFYGQASVPSYLVCSKKKSLKSLSAGYNNSFAVLGDDKIVGWGSNMHNQLSNIPTMFSPSAGTTTTVKVDKVAVGARHVIALYEDLNQNTYITSWGAHDENTVPISMGNIKDISAGSEHNIALLDDGTVFGWGKNSDGQAKGVATTADAWGSQGGLVSGNNGVTLDDVVGVSAGSSHNIALRKDSTISCWGSNWAGQSVPPAGLTGVVQVSAGLNHSLALKSDGQVVAWGNDKFGQSTVPSGVAIANTGIESVETAGNSSIALMKDGSIISWGASILLDRKLKNSPKYKIKSIYGGLEHAVSTDTNLIHDGKATRTDDNVAAAPIAFTHSLQGEYDDINIIKYNSGASSSGGSILTTYFKHGLFTGNKVRIGTSSIIYYIRNEGDYKISLHHTAANASTGQERVDEIGKPGEDIFIMATSAVSRKVVSAENSLVKTSLDHKFVIGDKVKFELSSWNKDKTIDVKIKNGGDNLKSAPTLNIAAPSGGLSTDVKATAIVLLDSNGSIRKAIVTNPGKGYVTAPAITLSNLNFSVKKVNVTNPGSGYTTAPNIEFTGGGGSGAIAVAVLDGMTNAWTIESITIVDEGQGYSSAPTVKITGGGVDKVGSISLVNKGSGYTSAPTVSLVGGGGAGATATASITEQGTDQWGQTTTVTRDYITSLTLTNAGSGYSQAPTVVFSGGGGSSASATASLEGVNASGTQATATAVISTTTVDLESKLGGSLGTLANELVDEVNLNAVYFTRPLGDKGLTIHRTQADALNDVNALDFGIDNVFSQLAIVKLLNDPLQTTTSDKPIVSQTLLSQEVSQGSVSLAVENSNGFESGKQIIIDENDCQEEKATILRATSSYLILTKGTTYSHEKGKTVKLVLSND